MARPTNTNKMNFNTYVDSIFSLLCDDDFFRMNRLSQSFVENSYLPMLRYALHNKIHFTQHPTGLLISKANGDLYLLSPYSFATIKEDDLENVVEHYHRESPETTVRAIEEYLEPLLLRTVFNGDVQYEKELHLFYGAVLRAFHLEEGE